MNVSSNLISSFIYLSNLVSLVPVFTSLPLVFFHYLLLDTLPLPVLLTPLGKANLYLELTFILHSGLQLISQNGGNLRQ